MHVRSGLTNHVKLNFAIVSNCKDLISPQTKSEVCIVCKTMSQYERDNNKHEKKRRKSDR